MSLGEHPHHELFDHVLLTDDDPLHLSDRLAEQAGGFGIAHRGIRVPGADVLATGNLEGRSTTMLVCRVRRRCAHKISCLNRRSHLRGRRPGWPAEATIPALEKVSSRVRLGTISPMW